MQTEELHQKLVQAYSLSNLNKISLTLIKLYKDKKYSVLRKIADHISNSICIEIDESGKGFSKFMMLYHPDRADFHLMEIDRLAKEDNYEDLLSYAHILQLSRIEELESALNSYEDVDYSPVYEWDIESKGFSYFYEQDEKQDTKAQTQVFCTFYDAIKNRMFEDPKMEFPSYYLEDIDEIELASSGINELEGLEYCKHVKKLDLSDNCIFDLSLFFSLSYLEELDLSDNEIELIDTLGNLEHLKSLNLSNNPVSDITPLLDLPWLEYIDLKDTNVPEAQIKMLTDLGIIVEN